VGDPAGIAMALEGLGAWALGAGDLAAARAYLEEGLATAEIMHIYCYLGLVALEEGKVTEAREHFGTYLRRAHAIDLKDGIAQGLEGFASIAAASGQAPRATCLAAAADALRELTGAPLSPYQREQLDRRLRPAADALSGPAYEVAWNEGRRMATDDAIAYALET
jgi:hypothetical protein